jgi:class 3 adenylate cyclase
VLVSQRVVAEVKGDFETEFLGDVNYKGFQRPIPTYNVLALQ